MPYFLLPGTVPSPSLPKDVQFAHLQVSPLVNAHVFYPLPRLGPSTRIIPQASFDSWFGVLKAEPSMQVPETRLPLSFTLSNLVAAPRCHLRSQTNLPRQIRGTTGIQRAAFNHTPQTHKNEGTPGGAMGGFRTRPVRGDPACSSQRNQ